jgi:hypothetical protein
MYRISGLQRFTHFIHRFHLYITRLKSPKDYWTSRERFNPPKEASFIRTDVTMHHVKRFWRMAFNVFAVASALVCVTTCICWPLSYSWLKSPYGAIGGNTYRIGLDDGDILAYHFYPDHPWGRTQWTYNIPLRVAGYMHTYGTWQETASVVVDMWLIVILSGLPPIAWLVWHVAIRRRKQRVGFQVVIKGMCEVI